MRKTLNTILFLLMTTNSLFAQQIVIGPTFGHGFVNIIDSKSDNDRAVIGNALWNSNFGGSVIYYFDDPLDYAVGRIGFLFRVNNRGSISETNNKNKFEFSSNTFGLFGGIAGNIGMGNIFYIDAGFGYNALDNTIIYEGDLNQTEAFENLDENLVIKPNEVTFIYAIGFEKAIIQDKLKLFLELNGDAAISKLNENNGAFRTQSLGFGIGLHYVFNLKNKQL